MDMKKLNFCLMIIIISIFFCISFFNSTDCRSSINTIQIYGKVTDDKDVGIPMATVMFISESDTTSTFSDENGYYSLELEITVAKVNDNSADSPYSFKLYQNYPNPFNPSTTLKYELPERANVFLDIYNITGQATRHLKNCVEGPGKFRVQWDGCDNDGRKVGAGVYIYRLKAGNFVETKKMLIMDGGSSGGDFSFTGATLNTTAKISETTYTIYRIVVGQVGFIAHIEKNFIVPDGVSELEKDFILEEYESFAIYIASDNISDDWTIQTDNLTLLQPSFLSASDITAYEWNDHYITYPDSVWVRLKTWDNLLHKLFVVTVGNERIYWGRFLDLVDSRGSINPIIWLNPRHPDGRNTTPDSFSISEGKGYILDPDPRIDPRIYNALEKSGVLIQ